MVAGLSNKKKIAFKKYALFQVVIDSNKFQWNVCRRLRDLKILEILFLS